jgi:hypothetical protein
MNRNERKPFAKLRYAVLTIVFAIPSCQNEPGDGPGVDARSTVDGEKIANPAFQARDGV